MSKEAPDFEGNNLPPMNPRMIKIDLETDLMALEAGKTPDEIAKLRRYLSERPEVEIVEGQGISPEDTIKAIYESGEDEAE